MESDRVNAISKSVSPTLCPISGLTREERIAVLEMSLRRTEQEIVRLEAQLVLIKRGIAGLIAEAKCSDD